MSQTIYQANTYLKRNGEDQGMLVNLNMNNHRVTNTAEPVEPGDVANLFSQKRISDVTSVLPLPRMTSNTTPPLFRLQSKLADEDVWKCASKHEDNFWEIQNSYDYVIVSLDRYYDVNGVQFDLMETEAERVNIKINDESVMDVTNVSGLVYLSFPRTKKLVQMDIEFFNTKPFYYLKLRQLYLRFDTLVPRKPIEISMPQSETQAINSIVLADQTVTQYTVQPEFINPVWIENGDTQDGFVITSEPDNLVGSEAWRIFDFDYRTNSQFYGVVDTAHYVLNCPTLVNCTGVEICCSTELPSEGVTFYVEGSVNGTLFNQIILSQGLPDSKTFFKSSDVNAYKYFRVTLLCGAVNPLGLNCFNLYGLRNKVRNGILSNIADPVGSLDATNKNYVDTTFVPQSHLKTLLKKQLLLDISQTVSFSSLLKTMPIQKSPDIPDNIFSGVNLSINANNFLIINKAPCLLRLSGKMRFTNLLPNTTFKVHVYKVLDLGSALGITFLPFRENVISVKLISINSEQEAMIMEHLQVFQDNEAFAIRCESNNNVDVTYCKLEVLTISY